MSKSEVFPHKTETKGALGTYVANSFGGITKRELFALHLWASLMTADPLFRSRKGLKEAVQLADTLLKELEDGT